MSEKAWGTPVMMLGRTRSARVSGLAAAPGTGSALGAAQQAEPAPVDWGFLIGSYAGSWLGGAAIGYIVGRNPKAAVTGGIAASGVWGVGETVAYARTRRPIMSAVFVTLGIGSLAVAWLRR